MAVTKDELEIPSRWINHFEIKLMIIKKGFNCGHFDNNSIILCLNTESFVGF